MKELIRDLWTQTGIFEFSTYHTSTLYSRTEGAEFGNACAFSSMSKRMWKVAEHESTSSQGREISCSV